MAKCIRDYFSSTPGSINANQHNNYSIVLPFYQVTDVELLAEHNTQNNHIMNSVQEKINELEKFIIGKDQDDGSILSDIDLDLNILFNMNDTIHNSSRYYDTCSFCATFNKHTHIFLMLDANIRGIATNLDTFKFLLDDLDQPFPIIGLTETWLNPIMLIVFS